MKGVCAVLCFLSLLCPQFTNASTKLEGRWMSADYTSLIFKNNQYQLFENGLAVDQGSFSINGNIMTTQSRVSGEVAQYAFNCQNNILMLQDAYGQIFQFSRSSGSSGSKNSQGAARQPQQRSTNQNTSAQVVNFLSGTWKDIRSSGHTIIDIRSNGTFSYYSDYAASGQFSNQYGDQTGSWGYGNQDGMQGRWQAKGSPQRGTIYYQSQNGEQGTMNYQVMIENGQIYWNECYFDGTLYQRQR